MSDQITSINEEVEVTLKLKVKIKEASHFGTRTKEQLQPYIDDAKQNLEEQLLHLIVDEYPSQDLSSAKDNQVHFNYEVENVN